MFEPGGVQTFVSIVDFECSKKNISIYYILFTCNIGFDTAENEPPKAFMKSYRPPLPHFSWGSICPIIKPRSDASHFSGLPVGGPRPERTAQVGRAVAELLARRARPELVPRLGCK